MTYKNSIIASLDIGSHKICCMIAAKEDSGIYKIIGLGHSASLGIKSGIVIDMDLAQKSIYKTISIAEKQAGIKISGVSVSITAPNISSEVITVEIDIDEEVTQKDLEHGYSIASGISEKSRTKNIHTFPLNYSIDGASGIKDPIGMFAEKLSINLIVVRVVDSLFRTYIKCITKCDVNVLDVVSSSYAAGLAVLKEDELNIGSVLIEMGSSTTSIGVFVEGQMVFTKTLAVGGDSITLEVARKFSISIEEAEKIKVMHASAITGSEDSHVLLDLPNFIGRGNFETPQITRSGLVLICKPIIERIFSDLKNELVLSGYGKLVSRTLVLTGGASQLDGVNIIARDIFGYQTRIGYPINIRSNITDIIDDTTFSVSCGLITKTISNYSTRNINKKINRELKENLTLGKIKSWIGENFL